MDACAEGRGEVSHERGDNAKLGCSGGRGAMSWSQRAAAHTRSGEVGTKCGYDGEATCGVSGGGCCPSAWRRLEASAAKYIEVRQPGAEAGRGNAANSEVTSWRARGEAERQPHGQLGSASG